MKLNQITYYAIALFVFMIYAPSTYATTGLGALEGFLYILVGLAVVGLLGLLAFILNLVCLSISKREGHPGKLTKFARFFSIIFLVLTTPVYIGMLVSTERHFLVYLFLLLYLAVITSLWLQWSTNRRRVYAVVVVLLLLAVFRSSDIISYTKYNLVDNDPLGETVELAEQRHSLFLHLADGRIFRFTKRTGYHSAGDDKKFDRQARLQFEVLPGSGIKNRYRLYGIGKSSAYSNYLRFAPKPLLTLPFNTVDIDMNQKVYYGEMEMLAADWRATNRTLQTSVTWQCCDPQWVEELIQRGADPTYISYGSHTMLHNLMEYVPKHEHIVEIAEILIRSGAVVDARDEWGNTPLLLGVDKIENRDYYKPEIAKRYKDVFTVLLESGADPNVVNKHGMTALYDAVTWHRYDLARLLVKYGAVPTKKYSGFGTAYDRAYGEYENQKRSKKKEINPDLELLLNEMKH